MKFFKDIGFFFTDVKWLFIIGARNARGGLYMFRDAPLNICVLFQKVQFPDELARISRQADAEVELRMRILTNSMDRFNNDIERATSSEDINAVADRMIDAVRKAGDG